ncbi:MAG: hypothetical protein OXF46_04495 [Rhodobacteraceae bacterium]|nr:hypothetical protein [Paracoccaceae bacterium]
MKKLSANTLVCELNLNIRFIYYLIRFPDSKISETASLDEWKSRDWQQEVRVENLIPTIEEVLAK